MTVHLRRRYFVGGEMAYDYCDATGLRVPGRYGRCPARPPAEVPGKHPAAGQTQHPGELPFPQVLAGGEPVVVYMPLAGNGT